MPLKLSDEDKKAMREAFLKSDYAVRKIFIGSEATKLYSLEHQRNEIIRACAQEWMRVCKMDKAFFWKVGISTALYDLLGGYDHNASLAAAKAFLEEYGYAVQNNLEEK
jgi:hypothetical protein